MKLKTIRFLSGFMAVLLLSFLCVPAFASSGSTYSQKVGFWDWAVRDPVWKFLGISDFVGYTFGFGCPTSDDGYHHANSYEVDWQDGTYKCICFYCGHSFTAYESDLKQSYNDYVDTLPFTGYDSAGSFLWYPSSSNVKDPKIHFATYTSSQHFYLSDCQNYTCMAAVRKHTLFPRPARQRYHKARK